MSTFEALDIQVRRYTLGEGASLYADWGSGIDAFDSPAFRDPHAFLEWLSNAYPIFKERETLRARISEVVEELTSLPPSLDLSQAAFQRAFASIAKLKRGEELTDEECNQLYSIFRFIDSVVNSEPNNGGPKSNLPSLYAPDTELELLVDNVLGKRARATQGLPSFFETPPVTNEDRRKVAAHLERFYSEAKSAVPEGWENVLTYETPFSA